MASYVVINALAVPLISSNAAGTANVKKSKSNLLQGDEEGQSGTSRLSAADSSRRAQGSTEPVRTELSRLANCVDTMLETIDRTILGSAEAAKKEVLSGLLPRRGGR